MSLCDGLVSKAIFNTDGQSYQFFYMLTISLMMVSVSYKVL